jgi:hypothetical protein
MIYKNYITGDTKVICDSCMEMFTKDQERALFRKKRLFREEYGEVTKQWLLKLPRFRIYITIFRMRRF